MPAHTPPPSGLDYKTALHEEHHLLADVQVPIVTVSATYRQQLEHTFYESFPDEEVVFSRAHYSMALGLLLTAIKNGYSAWMSDPTNYVPAKEWSKVTSTHHLGKIIARNTFLKQLKDMVDTQVRSKFPLTTAIDDPLLYITKKVTKPIISLHYEAGNILAKAGHSVLQVVTDPHVRPQYVDSLPSSTLPTSPSLPPAYFAVFDAATKTEFLEKAQSLSKVIDPDHVVVTGPPIDPRILSLRQKRLLSPTSPTSLTSSTSPTLRIVITTGGLGQNFHEIKHILKQLAHHTHGHHLPNLELMLYASTHLDFKRLYESFAASIPPQTVVKILYANTIVAANELLLKEAFPWADVFITKPSGDMAYDCAAAGIPCLFLQSWGEWEDNIKTRFKTLKIGLDLDTRHVSQNLKLLSQYRWQQQSWFAYARKYLYQLPPEITHGSQNILTLHQQIASSIT